VLRETDRAIERVRTGEKPKRALTLAWEALKLCGEALPELVAELREHLAARLTAAGVSPGILAQALGRISPDSPNFPRLLALARERLDSDPDPLIACGMWEEFRRSAVRAGWFSEKSLECAVLYLHMASLLDRVPSEELACGRQRLAEVKERHFRGGELPVALMDTYYADPRELYRRACASDPQAEAFELWLDWEKRQGDLRGAEEAAELWRRSRPQDIPPLLYLMDVTEERGALEKSLGYIARAEALDGLNAEVRRARLRLLFRATVRNLRDRRPHLAFERLATMAALPQLQQGDRPALLAVLRWASAGICGREEEGRERRRELAALMEPAASTLLRWNVARLCRWREGWPDLAEPAQREDLAAAAARICALGDDVGIEFEIPREWVDEMTRSLSRGATRIDTRPLLALGEAALRRDNLRLAYAVSAAGLSRDVASEARFLFLRARALPGFETERRNQCLCAVIALARRQHDMELAGEAIEVRQGKRTTGRRSRRWREEEPLAESDLAILPEHLAALVEQERAARSFPDTAAERPPYVAQFAPVCQCPACRQRRGQPAFGEEADALPPPPPELVRELDRILARVEPEEALEALAALADSLGMPLPAPPLPGRRKRRRRNRYEEDDPF
jgi:hypothetical protein